jgi:hypothetical protein
MGVPVALLPVPAIGSDVSRSSDGLSIGAGTVNASVAGVHVDDVPYPPTIRVKGRLTGTQLTLTGTTTGMQPGTVVTVEIRDARKEKSRYVVQSKTVRVDARGSYRWTGTVKSTKVQVVTRTTTPAVSPPVTIVRVKR